MEAQGRAERSRDAGKDYWKLLPDNSSDDGTDAVKELAMNGNTRNNCDTHNA